MTLHETLGKVFAAFQHSASFAGTYHGNVLQTFILLEEIVNAFHQRIFRTNNNHIDAIGQHKLLNSHKVICLQGHIFACIYCTGIARRNKKFLYLLALCYLPSQGVLSAATTKQK